MLPRDSSINCFLKNKSIFLLPTLLIILSGCTWVNVNNSGKHVAIVSERHIKHCTKVGSIDVSTKASLIGIKRSQKKIVTELEILARNEATGMGADTLVAINAPIEGTQTYNAYRCSNI